MSQNIPTADHLADSFTAWAQKDGILARITEEQCRDLARAFGAGYLLRQAESEVPDYQLIRAAIQELHDASPEDIEAMRAILAGSGDEQDEHPGDRPLEDEFDHDPHM